MIEVGELPGEGIGPYLLGTILLRALCWFNSMVAYEMLLDVAGHVTVQDHPDLEWTVDALYCFEDVRIGDLDLDPEVLLLVDEDRVGEGSPWVVKFPASE